MTCISCQHLVSFNVSKGDTLFVSIVLFLSLLICHFYRGCLDLISKCVVVYENKFFYSNELLTYLFLHERLFFNMNV